MNKDETMTKILKSIKQKQPLQVNDIVYGTILVVKDKMIVVALDSCEDKRRVLAPADMGVAFLRDLDSNYVKSTEDCFRKGDLIRAKIKEVGNFEFKLITSEPDLGTIKAFCKKCKTELRSNDFKVRCHNCGTVQTRKFAKL